MSLAATLASRLAILFSGRVALLLLSLATMAILTRSLGPDGFGLYRSAVAYLSFALVFADLGLASVFVREISKPDADQQRLIANALALRVTLAVTVLSLAAGLSFVLPFEPAVHLAILCGAGGFVAYSLHLLLFGLFQQKLRQQGVILAEFFGGLMLLAMVFALGHFGAEPVWFIAALAASYVITFAITLMAARRLAPIGLLLEPEIWRRLIIAVLPVAATGGISIIFFRADVVILSILQQPTEVGLYSVAAKVLDAFMGFTLLLVGLFAPLFGRTARLAPLEFAEHFENSLTTLTVGTVGVALALVILANEIVVLLGGEAFRAAGSTLVLLSVVFVLHSILMMVREAATALQIQMRLLPGYMAGLAIAMAAYFTLIPQFGGRGAALALIVTEIVILAIALPIVIRAAAHPIRLRAPISAIASGVTAAGIALLLDQAEFGSLARATIGGASYLALLVLTSAVSPTKLISVGREILAKKHTS